MSFYKLESTYNIIDKNNSKKKKTYKYYIDTRNNLFVRTFRELELGGKVTVRTISQAEYIRGLKR